MKSESSSRPGVVITRPIEQSRMLAGKIQFLGYKVFLSPLLEIIPIPKQLNLSPVQAIVFTSANAIVPFSKANSERNLPVYAVGKATARVAEIFNFNNISIGKQNAESLIGQIVNKHSPKDGLILHISGETVTSSVEKVLLKHGFKVERQILYRAEAATQLCSGAIKAIKTGEVKIILFFSPRTAKIFVNLMKMEGYERFCSDMIALCLSDSVASNLPFNVWKKILVADAPQTDAMIEALKEALPL